MVRITLNKKNLFQSVVKNVPENTPKRREIVMDRYEDCLANWHVNKEKEIKKEVIIEVDIGQRFHNQQFNIQDKSQFTAMVKVCDEASETIESLYSIVLLPKKNICCDKPLQLKNSNNRRLLDGSECRVFSFEGVKKTKFFTSTCVECSSKFTAFYEDEKIDNTFVRRYYKPTLLCGTTTETAFSVKLLEHITDMTLLCSSEFRNTLDTLNRTLFSENPLKSRQCFEDAFFAFHIAQKLPNCPLVVKRDNKNMVLVDFFCSQAIPILRKVLSDPYIAHICSSDPSCKERACVIDGNEKNTR